MNFNQDFRDFYNKVTGDFEANHKGGKIYYIPFERSPKMAATTNYVPTLRKVLWCAACYSTKMETITTPKPPKK